MATKHLISAKVSEATLARLDAFAAQLSEAAHGAPVTRHAAHIIVIERGLDAVEQNSAPSRHSTRQGKGKRT